MANKVEFYLHNYIYEFVKNKFNNGEYKHGWYVDKCNNSQINQILKNASKNGKGNIGKPDLIYFNEDTQMLILVEIKNKKNMHSSNKLGKIENPVNFAVDGVLHYSNFFKKFNRFAIAISGQPNDFILDQFLIRKNEVEPNHIPAQRILNEFDYENIIEDSFINQKVDDLSSSLSKLNKTMDDYKIDANIVDQLF